MEKVGKPGFTIMEADASPKLKEGDASGRRRRKPVARSLVGDVVQFIDFLLVIAISVIVAEVYHRVVLITEFDIQYYAAAGIIGATGLTALLRRDGYYDFDRLMSRRRVGRAILSRWGLVLMALLAFGFTLKISENFSRAWLVAWSVIATTTVFFTHVAAASILRRMSIEDGFLARRIAVVGATTLAQKFLEQTRGAEDGVSIAGVYETGAEDGPAPDGLRTVGDLNDVAQAARAGEIDDIVIAVPRASQEDMARIVRRLSILPVSISICPNIHWLDHTGGAVMNVGGASLLSLYQRPLEDWGGVLKTAEDYVLGSILLLLASPILGAVAIAIKLQDRGPIFFVQQRHGFNNAVFPILKFRTMTVAEDGDEIVQAKVGDPRITPLGRFLRRYSIDELPQLINVIRGEMSLVGPRPHALAHNHRYARLIENYSGRHKVKPGITGWAQVNGFRGETSENEMMEDRVRFDLVYVDNWSIWFDLKILFLTVRAVLFPKNAV